MKIKPYDKLKLIKLDIDDFYQRHASARVKTVEAPATIELLEVKKQISSSKALETIRNLWKKEKIRKKNHPKPSKNILQKQLH